MLDITSNNQGHDMDNRERQAAFKASMRSKGFVAATEWVPSEHRELFRSVARALRDGVNVIIGAAPASGTGNARPEQTEGGTGNETMATLKRNTDQGKRHWGNARALWPAIAADMAALRAEYKSNHEFGAALALHGIEYSKDDRAAFLWMGSLKPEELQAALDRCGSRSPQHFMREVKTW